ncbi:MAG: hypothetical protein KAS39_05625, partial [Actinomycetia bacterium]|nr:hypothetical protein [Actinomycetes bacterium]
MQTYQAASISYALVLSPGSKFSFYFSIGTDAIMLTKLLIAVIKSTPANVTYFPLILAKMKLDIKIYKNVWIYLGFSINYIIDSSHQDKLVGLNDWVMSDSLLFVSSRIHLGVCTRFTWGKSGAK